MRSCLNLLIFYIKCDCTEKLTNLKDNKYAAKNNDYFHGV